MILLGLFMALKAYFIIWLQICYKNLGGQIFSLVFPHSLIESKRLGQPGMPGGQDLEEALRSLSARQESHSSDRPFFDVERERKLRVLGGSSEEGSSGFLTPNDSLASTGTNYSGSSQHSSATSSSRSYLPERLQIVKPLEGE